jgi:energy-coupling factor transporter transmembrane protein EcfT
MSTEASDSAIQDNGENTFVIFIISLCAAIVMAGGFGIVFEAFIIATANLFDLGSNFVWVLSGANVLMILWLTVWTFARSWHVERRVRSGLEVDEPSASILGNLRS